MAQPAALPEVAAGISAALQRAVKEGVLPHVGPDGEGEILQKPVGLFYDLDAWEANLQECVSAFGDGFVHAIAVKSNGLVPMLQRARELGFGCECASIGEVMHSERIGQQGAKIIFDSPCKTAAEIRYALARGMHINIDNPQELETVARIRESVPDSSSDIGLRINPLVGAGAIKALSVSTSESKFGMTVDRKEELVDFYRQHPWLNTVHVHVGSGGMGEKILVAGVKVAVEFAVEVNKTLGKDQVTVLDMGGGMPVNYSSEAWHTEAVPSFAQYAAGLRAEVPTLFPGTPGCPFKHVITEFGQSLNAKSGWLASRIEYTKPLTSVAGQIVVIHFGADVCLRQCYTSEHTRRLQFFDGSALKPKECSEECPMNKVHVAGPLCFQGDHITKDAEAPKLQQGDIVILREAGANTMSLFSRHCLRQCPAAYGYRTVDGGAEGRQVSEWTVLKPSEDLAGCSRHWGWEPSAAM